MVGVAPDPAVLLKVNRNQAAEIERLKSAHESQLSGLRAERNELRCRVRYLTGELERERSTKKTEVVKVVMCRHRPKPASTGPAIEAPVHDKRQPAAEPAPVIELHQGGSPAAAPELALPGPELAADDGRFTFDLLTPAEPDIESLNVSGYGGPVPAPWDLRELMTGAAR